MIKGIDWQMVAFIGGSLLQEYLRFQHLPRIHYFDEDTKAEDDDDRAA
ncbi:hypothetical protein [Halalkalibacter krulwichiae]|uniref:Uncharacterized protein n=1 Tax=Halalkalibacter krulwichiae TaxID=199441 RepID=A0A1X9MJJ3_9BACI|nr:hypothetical protein [Halalkalibacter krulwichiae]ARK31811.1 hypothetical protein BkAM31D_19300 [Halalkalibacter krulwichiae]